jgi:hypothetical protein
LGNIFEEKIGDLYSNNYLYKIIYPEKIWYRFFQESRQYYAKIGQNRW